MSDAIQHAAKLLASSRCPVISFDADVHGTRSVIALAEKLGAAYDHIRGRELLNEVALFTSHGGMFTTPGEVRRRADLIILVGDLPASHHELILSWASAQPDLAGKQSRRWFHLEGGEAVSGGKDAEGELSRQVKAVILSAEAASLGTAVALLRAELAGRRTATPITNLDSLKKALAEADFPVFVFSGNTEEPTSLAMLQGLVADLNRSKRASSLFLPSDDAAWGAVLTSVWMTGFPPRTGFPNGAPVYDPERWDIQRMLRDKEADLHLWISPGDEIPAKQGRIPLVALAHTASPVAGAAVTISIAAPGIDHDCVAYSSRTGTFRATRASAPSDRPAIAGIVRQLAQALPSGEAESC
ncbi:tungsten formylmethanofuran dehydrogenase [Phyllobacterium salinisoli]|uniref:tungsten formylmethanofuran dehydrogenase n=1 Tax=Phyllobacterium salinisoli TaxID=1899321 RepID=UPI001FE18468|nr:tungsten formylmethanofuran dehydrogenase [Phyllobacterium salinisoli]